ncbi:hypothetical protein TNCV_575781 [Trichonephila clavipes]|nr:hypothetical protein TNCV_575781 [Trichonephila clavipes]
MAAYNYRCITHQEEESPLLRCEIALNCPSWCVPLNGRQRFWAREHVSWTQTMGIMIYNGESLLLEEQRTRFQSNTVERQVLEVIFGHRSVH